MFLKVHPSPSSRYFLHAFYVETRILRVITSYSINKYLIISCTSDLYCNPFAIDRIIFINSLSCIRLSRVKYEKNEKYIGHKLLRGAITQFALNLVNFRRPVLDKNIKIIITVRTKNDFITQV